MRFFCVQIIYCVRQITAMADNNFVLYARNKTI